MTRLLSCVTATFSPRSGNGSKLFSAVPFWSQNLVTLSRPVLASFPSCVNRTLAAPPACAAHVLICPPFSISLLRSLSIQVALVHGAAHQVKRYADLVHVTPSDLDGTGITNRETLNVAISAANRVTHEILEGLSANDLKAACPNAVVAHPAGILGGVDHLFTGRVERVDAGLLHTLLEHGIVPVIPPIYSLRILPYVVPHVATWKRRVMRERDLSDKEEFHLHGV